MLTFTDREDYIAAVEQGETALYGRFGMQIVSAHFAVLCQLPSCDVSVLLRFSIDQSGNDWHYWVFDLAKIHVYRAIVKFNLFKLIIYM